MFRDEAKDLAEDVTNFLSLKDPDVVYVALATALSCRLDSDPVWMILVGPSSSGKTELLRMFEGKIIEHVTSLTENALVSNYNSGKDKDGNPTTPSLLNRLHRKCLIIKDMSEVITGAKEKTAKTWGVLRDAYDGYVNRAGGGAVANNRIDCKFSFLAAATKAIEVFDDAENKALGQRFMHWEIISADSDERENLFYRCLGLGKTSDIWRKEYQTKIAEFLERWMHSLPDELDCDVDGLFHLSELAAAVRTPVIRNKYERHAVTAEPEPEYGIRLGKQIYMVGCLVKAMGGNAKRVMRRLALSSMMPSARRKILEVVNQRGRVTPDDLADAVKVSERVIGRHIEDLCLLGIVARSGGDEDGPKTLFIDPKWKKHCRMIFDHSDLKGEVRDLRKIDSKNIPKFKRAKGRPVVGKPVPTVRDTIDQSLLDWIDGGH